MKQSWNFVLSAALIAMSMSGSAQAAPALDVSAVSGSPFDTAEVAQALDGNGMHGMTVTACLVSDACETRTWIGDGTTGGVASGTGWSLGLIGDSFNNKFIFIAGPDQWKSLMINTRGALAAFDWMDSNNVGSPGSELGRPFTLDVFTSSAALSTEYSIAAQYSDILYVGGQVYNDLYTVLTINISHPNKLGLTGTMEFFADTDRTAAISARQPPSGVPVPATLALAGLGLAGIALSRRRPAACS